MTNKGLYSLVVLTLIAVIAAAVVSRGHGSTNDPYAGTHVLPDMAPRLDEVARVAFVHGVQRTTVARLGPEWVVEEKGSYPADPVKVRQALLGLAGLTLVEPKTSKPDLYSRLEVEDADKKDAKSTLITVSDTKNSLLGEIIAGKRKVDELGGGNDGIYVRKPGSAQSWLARGTLDVTGDPIAWLDKKLLDVPAGEVKSVTLAAPDGQKLAFTRAKPDEDFALTTPPPAGKKIKEDKPLNDPPAPWPGSSSPDVEPAKDVAVPKDGVATARYETFDGLVVTVTQFNLDGHDWARIDASGTGDAAKKAGDLEAKLEPWLFGLPSFKTKLLQTKLDDVVEAPKPS